MNIKFKKAINIAFPNTRRKVGGISVSREGDRVFIDFETEKGQKLPGFVALPVDCLEQLVEAINSYRYEIVAEYDGIQLRHIYPLGGLEIQFVIVDKVSAEKWREEDINDWLEAAGVKEQYVVIHGESFKRFAMSCDILCMGWEENECVYDAEYAFCHLNIGYRDAWETLFSAAGVARFECVYPE